MIILEHFQIRFINFYVFFLTTDEGSRTIKEGYLIKKGNAVIEKWARYE